MTSNRKSALFAWALLILYVAFIYATLGSMPTMRNWLEDKYGEGVFATVTYIGAGIGAGLVLGYLIFRKKEKRIFPYLSLVFIGLFLRHAMREWITIPVEQIHFIEYGLVGYLSYNALRHHLRGWGVILAAFLLSYLFGMVDETIQGHIPIRVGAQSDMYWNGLAALMGLWVVVTSLRPDRIRGNSGLSEIKTCLFMVALCLPVQAYFNSQIAQFGHLIVDNERMVAFRSRLSPERLYRYDENPDEFKKLAMRLIEVRDGQISFSQLLSQNHNLIFEEALVRIFRRAVHDRQGHNLIVYKEDLILNGYFPQFIQGTIFDYPRERSVQLQEMLGDSAQWLYESNVAEHLITKFTFMQMMVVILLMEAGICTALIMLRRRIPPTPLGKGGI